MRDMIVAYAVMLALAVILGALAAKWLYPQRQDTLILLITLALVGMFAWMRFVSGQLYLAVLVSDSAAIVWTNLTPLLLALSAGWVLHLPKVPSVRRRILCILLAWGGVLALLWPSLGPLIRPPLHRETAVLNGVVMQSDWATCSPAAAATLLLHEGIETTESEMIPLCLTDRSGTPSLGLYRGLKIMAARHGRDVRLLQTGVDDLLRRNDWPVLLTVELPRSGVADARYEQEWGWIPGMGHSVVALGLGPEGLMVGDPSVGPEMWSREDLTVLWHGQALKLTDASTASDSP